MEEIEEKRTNVFFERLREALSAGQFQTEAAMVDRLLEQGFNATDIACAALQELRRDQSRDVAPEAELTAARQETIYRDGGAPYRDGRRDRKSGQPRFSDHKRPRHRY